jgi:hypothetical protein
MTLPCIRCDKDIPGVNNGPDYDGNQPSGGTTFSSTGQYGSTIFDPMDGSFIQVNVCDECLAVLAEKQTDDRPIILAGRNTRLVWLEYAGIVGYQDIPYETTVWVPGERQFKSRRNMKLRELDAPIPDDVHLNIEPQQLRDYALHLKDEGWKK